MKNRNKERFFGFSMRPYFGKFYIIPKCFLNRQNAVYTAFPTCYNTVISFRLEISIMEDRQIMNSNLFKYAGMKKWLQYFLVFLLAFTLTGCGAAPDGSAEKAGIGAASGGAADTAGEDTGDGISGTDELPQAGNDGQIQSEPDADGGLSEDGVYTSRDDVALYISVYGHLPSNFITKKEAQALGWEGGSLEEYAPGRCIGGSRFGNYEGRLPEKEGRVYTECDIDTLGADRRGPKRIVFSNDGLIYYTEDHYESFELLYGEE